MIPDVSVVVPVYNTVDYLRPCLDSLVLQTIGLDHLQVVAVDDGSTDGSSEIIDEYAARYPSTFVVVHQANSGGPARPFNVGLEASIGRFVLFLGSDDYLAEDAVERLVASADTWGSDVVLPPTVGVNGRFVDQRIYGADDPDVPFPHSLLPFFLANSKLFRRSLLTQHGIRFPLDLKVGSDQPFTVAAMLKARRISVLGPPTAYFGVKRDDQQNITYRSEWRDRLSAITQVMDHVAELVPEGDDRDAILHRHFEWELGKMITRDVPLCAADDVKELVAGLAKVADRYLTDGVNRRLRVLPRLRWWLVRHDRTADLLAVLAREDQRSVMHVEERGVFYAQPGFRAGVPDNVFLPDVENVRVGLRRSLVDAQVTIRGSRWLTVSTALGQVAPESVERIRFVLSVLPGAGQPRGPRTAPAEEVPSPAVSIPGALVADGRVGAEIDLRALVRLPDGRWSLRLRVVDGGTVHDLPVVSSLDGQDVVRIRQGLRSRGARLVAGTDDRVIVELEV